MRIRRNRLAGAVAAAWCFLCLGLATAPAQQPDSTAAIQQIDAAVKARVDHVAGYNVTEHYAVYRGKDEAHSVAEMTVRTAYRKGVGKSYTIVSESGSAFIRKHVLEAILDDEKEINRPGTVEHSWITSANYDMKLKHEGIERVDERDCHALTITPRRKAPNMIEGSLWVDAKDGGIVRIEGIASQSPSVFTGPAHVMRRYASVNGYSMATQARAVSDSFLLGRTIISIDYRDYQIDVRQ
jgi:outer membrane lipoprotein-sorting protein